MTEEKKTTTAKSTKGRKPAASKTTVKSTPVKAVEQEKPIEQKREITGDTEVVVYNNTSGKLLYSARKGTGYLALESFMDSDVMTVDELQQMRNGHRKVLEQGWIYVDDEEVLDHLRLSKLKDSVKSPETLQELLTESQPSKIQEVAKQLTANSKATLYKLLREGYENKTISNAHTIKLVEETLGVPEDESLLKG